jgi:hypothetical protein
MNLPYELCQITDGYDFIHATIGRMNADVDRLIMRDGKLPRPLCYGRLLRLGFRAYATATMKRQFYSCAQAAWFPRLNTYLAENWAEYEKQKARGRVPRKCLRVESTIDSLIDYGMIGYRAPTALKRVRLRRTAYELFGIEAVNGLDDVLELTEALIRRYLTRWPNHHTSDGGDAVEEF